jgi:hypothetical protein
MRITTINRNYDFAYGNGTGGATNGQTAPQEEIDLTPYGGIYAPKGNKIQIWALDAVVAKDVTVTLLWVKGGGDNNFRTIAAGGVSANGDTAADTAEYFSVSTKLLQASLTPVRDGKILAIRFAGAGVVDAKAATATLTLEIVDDVGPHEFGVGNGPGGAATGGAAISDEIDLRKDPITVQKGNAIAIKIVSAEIMKYPTVSLLIT